MNTFDTTSPSQTRKLGEMLAKKIRGGEIICLMGELGSGKTTFAQGVLKGLGAKGPYTSPTFVVMKKYHVTWNMEHGTRTKNKKMFHDAYHIDCYRVRPKDILSLGWEEIIANKKNIVIVEWAERIRRIIPKGAVWLKFVHLDNNKRKISFINPNIKIPITNKIPNPKSKSLDI
ncbi:MAG: tRNA (adenosine(37)-N6)-threonylcarbamoyltransferase complex ATPase subunit type 1 TsaE [Patescibacteria group bacterium]|nr:tRNA (adenosine(37)-N6)-threonylcarbamoyltransferase complex ATPase subunit type 1 TsaE [Patescibacteria group bacterium]